MTALELDDDHILQYLYDLSGNYRQVAIIIHTMRPDDTRRKQAGLLACEGAITFAGTATTGVVWQVECWNPLTLSPSLLCHCGDHGFIRQGKWVTA